MFVGVDPDPANADAIRVVDGRVPARRCIRTRWAARTLNFIGTEEGQERVQATYGSNYARLAEIKAKYDPENVFHVNQNIAPA